MEKEKCYMCVRGRRFNRTELRHILENTGCLSEGMIKVYKGEENYCLLFKKPELSSEDLKHIGKADLSLMISIDEEEEMREKIGSLEKKPQLIIVGTEYEEIPGYEITEKYLLTLLEQIRSEKRKKQ